MKDRRALIFIVFLVVVMVGGALFIRSGNDSSVAEDVPASNTTTSIASQTTAPITQRTKEDFDTAVRRVTAIENELFTNPDPSRVGEIMTAECSCYGETRAALSNLASKGWRVKAANIAIESTSVYSTKADEIEGVVEVSTFSNPAIDKSGNSVEKPPTPSNQPLVYLMKKGQDGVWRIYDRHLPEEVF